MKTLTIDESKAKEIYPKSEASLKAILEDTFGKKFFLKKITERITSYEDACEDIGIDAFDSLPSKILRTTARKQPMPSTCWT